LSGKTEKMEEKEKMAAKQQRLFMRIVGLFLILYGLLILSQPEQYGLGISLQYTPILGIMFVVIGIILALKK
jgi:uncharacterized membrane protein HdeD (DUF308 family)